MDDDGTEIMRVDGGKYSVKITPEFMQKATNKATLHNHPTMLPTVFTPEDIGSDGFLGAKSGEIVSKNGQIDKITYSQDFSFENAKILADKIKPINDKYMNLGYDTVLMKNVKNGKVPNMTLAKYESLSTKEKNAFVELETAKMYVKDTQKILIDLKLQKDLGFKFESTYKSQEG